MNVKEKLDVFSRLALREAEEKKDGILKQLDKEFSDACKEYSLKARKKAELVLQEETFKAERDKNKEILFAKSEVRRSLYELKAQLINDIFDQVQNMIIDYIESDEYCDDLVKGIRKLSIKYGGHIKVYITSKDMIFADKIKETPNIDLVADDSLVGGYKAFVEGKNIIIDNSYLEKLNAVRSDFKGFNIS